MLNRFYNDDHRKGLVNLFCCNNIPATISNKPTSVDGSIGSFIIMLMKISETKGDRKIS